MTCYEYSQFPPADVRATVLDWLRVHGIDGNRVLVPGWIVTRPGARQVLYLSYEVDESDGGPAIVGGSIVERIEVLQLESPPMPLPRNFVEWARHAPDTLAEVIPP